MEQPSTVLQPLGTDPVARAEALLAPTDLLARATDDLPALLRTAAETIARLCGDTAGVWLVEGPTTTPPCGSARGGASTREPAPTWPPSARTCGSLSTSRP